jgi:hypothetical protein
VLADVLDLVIGIAGTVAYLYPWNRLLVSQQPDLDLPPDDPENQRRKRRRRLWQLLFLLLLTPYILLLFRLMDLAHSLTGGR